MAGRISILVGSDPLQDRMVVEAWVDGEHVLELAEGGELTVFPTLDGKGRSLSMALWAEVVHRVDERMQALVGFEKGATPPEGPAYEVGAALNVVPETSWRERPSMFLGTTRPRWSVVVERFLSEVAHPARAWRRASLQVEGRSVHWVDDCDDPVPSSGGFWRPACVSMSGHRTAGETRVELVLDPWFDEVPTLERVVHLARRCTARREGRSMEIEARGGRSCVSADWSAYLARGPSRDGASRPGAISVDWIRVGQELPEIEVLVQGVPRGVWPGLRRALEGEEGLCLVVHTERALERRDLERRGLKAVCEALCIPQGAEDVS